MRIDLAAAELLDLSPEPATMLFWHSNNLNDLREYVRQLEETGTFEPSARYIACENDEEYEDDDDD